MPRHTLVSHLSCSTSFLASSRSSSSRSRSLKTPCTPAPPPPTPAGFLASSMKLEIRLVEAEVEVEADDPTGCIDGVGGTEEVGVDSRIDEDDKRWNEGVF